MATKDKGACKVRVTEPVLLVDDNGFTLDVSHTAFNKSPDKTYSVPDSPFWANHMNGPNARLDLVSKVAAPKEAEAKTDKDENK